jgi:pimeloyl-ACP methyl ester carboxylesterase
MPVLRTSGIEIAYEERGRGAPLVLISGIGMQLVSWPETLLDKLAERGHRVIVFDNRDVGLSSKYDALGVPDMRKLAGRALLGRKLEVPYSLFDMAGDVKKLFGELGLERAHVVGVSMGGMVAQALAIAHPEIVDRLVLMMTYCGSRRFPGRPKAVSRFLMPPPRTREDSALMQLDFFRTAGSKVFARNEVLLMERARLAWDRCVNPAGFARQFAACLAIGDLRPKLASVRTPTLVLHGSVDPIFRPVCAADTAKALPKAKLEIIEGWGHDLAEGAQDLVVDAIASHLSSKAEAS